MKVIKATYFLLSFMFVVWFVLSWLGVVLYNTVSGYEYSYANLFYLFAKVL